MVHRTGMAENRHTAARNQLTFSDITVTQSNVY